MSQERLVDDRLDAVPAVVEAHLISLGAASGRRREPACRPGHPAGTVTAPAQARGRSGRRRP